MGNALQVTDVQMVATGAEEPCLICGRLGDYLKGVVVDTSLGGAPTAFWTVCGAGPGEVAMLLTVADGKLTNAVDRDTFCMIVGEQATDAVDSPDRAVAAAKAAPAVFGRALTADEALAHPLGQRAIEVMSAVYLGVPEINEQVRQVPDLDSGLGSVGGQVPDGAAQSQGQETHPEPMLGLLPPGAPLGELDFSDTTAGVSDCPLCGREHRVVFGYVWEAASGTEPRQVANFDACGEGENEGWGAWTLQVQISALIKPPGIDTLRGQGTFTARTDGERVAWLDPGSGQAAQRAEDPDYFAFSDGPLLTTEQAQLHPWATRISYLIRALATGHPATVLMLGRQLSRASVRGFARVQAHAEGWLEFVSDDVIEHGEWISDETFRNHLQQNGVTVPDSEPGQQPDPSDALAGLDAKKVVTFTNDSGAGHDPDFGPDIEFTRAMGLEAGALVDATAVANEAGIGLPTVLTRRAWDDLVEWGPEDDDRKGGRTGQSIDGRLWDIMWMASVAARRADGDSSTVTFELGRVPRDGTGLDAEQVSAVLHVGPGDQGEPVATILLPGED